MRLKYGLMLVFSGFIAGALSTVAVSAAAGNSDADSIYRKLEILAQVLSHIENHYVDTVSAADLTYGAAKGAMRALDDHSAFYTPDEYKDLVNATEGEYAGIGISVSWDNDVPEVDEVLEDSPAHRAGVVLGDRLIAIDGVAVSSLSAETTQERLRGPVGSKVVLTLRHQARGDNWTFTLVRTWLRVPPVEIRRIDGGVVYAKVKTFSRRVAIDLASQLTREQGAPGVILDLRGNPGGLFDEAIEMTDLFLRDGPIVTAVGRGGRVIERYQARLQGHELILPLAVLIDGSSASAAEVVAGALADRGRARLFGTRSYGKGSVQSVFDLADGSGLKLTVARYYTPSGRQIDRHGIQPDEYVAARADGDAVLTTAAAWLRRQK